MKIIPNTREIISLKRVSENSTGKMGLHWIYKSMIHSGLDKKIAYRFRAQKNHLEKSPWEKITAGMLLILSGGKSIEELEYLRTDAGLLKSIGIRSMISPDTLLRFLSVKNNSEQLEKCMQDQSLIALNRFKGTSITYDHDATYYNSEKDCASYSYKKEKQMSAALGTSPELNGMCLTAHYRSGNVSPAYGILDDLKRAVALCKKAGKKIKCFRSDSASHNLDIFQYCEKNNIHFFVSIDKNAVTKRELTGIPEKKWEDLDGQEGSQWAEFTHCMARGKKNILSMRALALRWPNPDPTLFDESPYCYHIITTNNWKIAPMDWLKFHNGRMSSENIYKELKTYFAASYTPSHDFTKNKSFFMLNLMAYNAFVLFKTHYLEKDQHSWTIRTLRYRFINTLGRFVSHARRRICHAINVTDETWQLLKYCSARLCLSG